MALTEKLSNIGNAIREKTGKTELLTLDEMPNEIKGISGGGSGKELFRSLVDRSVTRITTEDLGNITVIGDDAIEHCDKLTYLEIPDSVTTIRQYGIASNQNLKSFTIPENCLRIQGNAFGTSAYADWVKINWKELPKNENGSGPMVEIQGNFAKKYLVHGCFYDELVSSSIWAIPSIRTEPFDEYVKPLSNKNSLFNVTQSITVNLQNYTSIPVYSITTTNDNVVSVSNFSATTEAITFDIVSHEIEGTATINVDVNGAEDYVFHRTFDVIVYEKIEDSTYEVVPIEDAAYGFTLNSSGYYESQNQKIVNSYAICRVNIHNSIGRIMYLDCINYAEANYDYGIIGKKNVQLARSNADDGVNAFYSFKGKSISTVQIVADDEVSGDCFIEIKYRKDSSGDQNNDSLQFKIRFED